MEHDFCLTFRVKVNSIVVTYIKGEYKVNVIGHGHEDKRGVRRLGGKNGAQIAQDLKSFKWMSYAKLAKVSLMLFG
jgi:hypothetical protein